MLFGSSLSKGFVQALSQHKLLAQQLHRAQGDGRHRARPKLRQQPVRLGIGGQQVVRQRPGAGHELR